MKKNTNHRAVACLVIFLTFIGMATSTGSANAVVTTPRQFNLDIKVLYNARQIESDVKPEVVNSTVFVPFRAVSDALGAQLAVTPDWKTITFAKGDRKVAVTIGSKTAVVNGKNVALTVAPYATKGRTMVPTRFVSEQLGETVEWDSLSRYVWIGHKNVPTLEEVVEAVDIKPFLPMYTGRAADGALTNYNPKDPNTGQKYTKARIIKETDWPLVIDGQLFSRMDRVVIDGKEYIRSIQPKRAVMGRSFFFLQEGEPLKYRQEMKSMRESIGDLRVHYNLVVDSFDKISFGIKDYDKLKLKDIDYVGINVYSDAAVLVANYFK
jgi:hypothetical protein